jgi:hypothetical protein
VPVEMNLLVQKYASSKYAVNAANKKTSSSEFQNGFAQ